MQKYSIGILTAIFALTFSALCYAQSEWRGVIPGALAWNVESVVEQWTQTSDVYSESFEQIYWKMGGARIGEHDFVPIDQRYNRQLVITIGFLNLGSETYHFDFSSRLEVSISDGRNTISADAVPTADKTVIAPNGQVKKCSFFLKMNNRAFSNAFDKRYGIGNLSINLANGKLIMEDSKGASLLDSVESPGKVLLFSTAPTITTFIFTQVGKTYNIMDVLTSINQLDAQRLNPSEDYCSFVINKGTIDSIYRIQNVISEKSEYILLYSFNNKPINNNKTSELLNMEFHSNDCLHIGLLPVVLLKQYVLPNFYCKILLDEFKDNIALLPESIAPQKYQDVHNAPNGQEFWLKLKEYAQSGDSEAIEEILRHYNPDLDFFKNGFLFKDYTELFQWLKSLSDKGFDQAHLGVGLLYMNGIGVKADLSKALKYFKKAIKKNNSDAMVYYAHVLYQTDKGVFEESVKWYRKAAELGNVRGQYYLAMELLKTNQIEEGIEWLQKAADKGYPEALFRMGLQYFYGDNVPRDDKKAFSLIEQAANNKCIKAYAMLGFFYLAGIGVEPNEEMAVLYYQQGAEEGVPEAMYWYGSFLCEGFYVERNVSKGYKLIKQAAEMGYPEAILYIGLDYHTGTIAQKNPSKAFVWLNKAADKGSAAAMAVLGDVYLHGDGVIANKEKALELYRKAAELENPYGIFRWGQHLYEQDGINAQLGLNYIKAAAQMGNQAAQNYLDNLDELESDEEEDGAPENNASLDDDIDDLDEEEENDKSEIDNNRDDDVDDLDEDPFE